MFLAVATGIKDAAPIVMPKLRQMSGIRKRRRNLEDFLDRVVKVRRDCHLIEFCENPRMEEKVQGIRGVIHGLLKVCAILTHLALCFPQYDFPAAILPTRSCLKTRAQ